MKMHRYLLLPALLVTMASIMGFSVPNLTHDKPVMGVEDHDSLSASNLLLQTPVLEVNRLNNWAPDYNLNVDLRNYCPPIYMQGHLGSCTAFASAKGILEVERNI